MSVPIKGMDEMSVQLDDRTNFREAFLLLATVPSQLRGWMKPSLKKLGDFTVAEGQRHPLVYIEVISCPY